MKKLAFLLLTLFLAAWNIRAQGTFQFKNNSSFPILIGDGFESPTPIGTNANSVALGGGPGQVSIELYVALASAPTQYFLAGTTLNSTSSAVAAQGTFNGDNPYTIPTTVDGDAFTTGTAIDFYFVGISQSSFLEGTSSIGTGYVLGGGTGTPPASFGNLPSEVQGFIIGVPEPHVYALAGLGAAAMLLYRRKK